MGSAFKAFFQFLTIAPLTIWLPAKDLTQRPPPAQDVGEASTNSQDFGALPKSSAEPPGRAVYLCAGVRPYHSIVGCGSQRFRGE